MLSGSSEGIFCGVDRDPRRRNGFLSSLRENVLSMLPEKFLLLELIHYHKTWWGIFFFSLISSISPQSTLNLANSGKTSFQINNYLYLFEDKTGTMTIDNILNSQKDIFHINSRKNRAFGFSKSAFWGRFTWIGGQKDSQWYLLFDYALLDKIELYIQDPVKGFMEKRINGNSLPLDQKEFNHRKAVFILTSSANSIQNIYFKIKSDDTVEIPVLLLTNKAFHERESENSLILGMYYGIILVMLIYNFFLYLSIRDITYLNYVVYIFSYGVVQAGLDGYLYQYIFPQNGALANTVRIIFGNVAIFFGLRFADSFFNIKKNFPKLKITLFIIYSIAIVNSVITLIDFYLAVQVLFVLMMLSVVIFLYFSMKLFNKYPPVRLYFLAWFVFILATFLWSLKLFHIYLPGLTSYSMQIGSAIEVTLLSFALGNRINLINVEKESMRIEALSQKQVIEKNRFQIESLRKRNRSIEKELQMARDIQVSMIPVNSTYDNIHGLYLPMDTVGGDFYDIIPLDDHKIGIFISDVSGHGIPAALITVMLRSMILTGINERLIEKENSWLSDPRKFIFHMNNYLHGHLQGNFITAFYGIYDNINKTLKYVSASHPPPILLSYGSENQTSLSFINVSPQSLPLGIFSLDSETNKIAENTITISQNDRLIFYTDGLMDNIGYDFLNYEKGMDSFQGTFLYNLFHESKNMDIKTFLENLSVQLLLFKEATSLDDDVCVVALEAKNE